MNITFKCVLLTSNKCYWRSSLNHVSKIFKNPKGPWDNFIGPHANPIDTLYLYQGLWITDNKVHPEIWPKIQMNHEQQTYNTDLNDIHVLSQHNIFTYRKIKCCIEGTLFCNNFTKSLNYASYNEICNSKIEK